MPPLALSVFDCLTHTAFLYFPLYYVAREAIFERRSLFSEGFSQAVWENWSGNFRRDLQANLAVWVPIMFVAFRYVPRSWLWPYMSTSGILWAFTLNWMQFGSFL